MIICNHANPLLLNSANHHRIVLTFSQNSGKSKYYMSSAGQVQMNPLCDNCRYGEFSGVAMELACARGHDVRFQAAPNETGRTDAASWYARRQSRWGWLPVVAPCPDYRAGRDGNRIKDAKLRRHQPQAFPDPTYHPMPSNEDPRPVLDPPVGPCREPLPVHTDLPGLHALDEKYAAELHNGRQLSRRLFGGER